MLRTSPVKSSWISSFFVTRSSSPSCVTIRAFITSPHFKSAQGNQILSSGFSFKTRLFRLTQSISSEKMSTSTPTPSSYSIVDESYKDQPKLSAKEFVADAVANNKVVVFSKSWCPFCIRARDLLSNLGIQHFIINLDWYEGNYGNDIQAALLEETGQKTVPNIHINGQFVGGCSDLEKLVNENGLQRLLSNTKPLPETAFDLIVIGGGSGGIAAAKEVAKQKLSVMVCDYVQPSPAGTTWGLGGTCVNVGCIPKKLMHQAALIRDTIEDAPDFGFTMAKATTTHDWREMVDRVQAYIKSLNWNIKTDLKKKQIAYNNAKASFIDVNTVKLSKGDNDPNPKIVHGKKILIAVGGRPRYPDFPGAKKYCITSDDIFSLRSSPGKTLIIGASYIALECAGFIHGLGYEVDVMVRSKLLRGFDDDVVAYLGKYMEHIGIKFIKGCVPTEVTLETSPKGHPKKVVGAYNDGGLFCDHYETVILAVGRDPSTKGLGLENIPLHLDPKSGKIKTRSLGAQTNIPHIYAIGDVVHGNKELTPVAIKSAQILARCIASKPYSWLELRHVPTTVFTPLEYSSVGYTEDEAIEEFKEENLEIFHTQFIPLEHALSKNRQGYCYVKMICLIEANNKKYPVIGLHILGPNSGEMIQGFALAIKMGACKSDFDDFVGIHPTCAETLTSVTVTKRSGDSVEPGAC